MLDLINQDDNWAFIFKNHLKDDKHYYLILKTFQESYYDVQTYWVEIIKLLDLEFAIKEKIFSFMNYSVCPPEERGIDIHNNEANAYHSPIFTNKIKNILEQTEEMKENTNISSTSKHSKFKDRQKVTFDQSSDEKPNELLKKDSDYRDADPGSSTSYGKFKWNIFKYLGNLKLTGSIHSQSSFEESGLVSPREMVKNLEYEYKNKNEYEEMKTAIYSNDNNDPLDQYLKRLGRDTRVHHQESPVREYENKLEFNPHRQSGRSSSPHRKSETYKVSVIKDSTNVQLTGITWSTDNILHHEEDTILEELNDLYNSMLSWIFASKADELDSSRPIKFAMLLPIWLNLAAKSSKLMKQKAISDLNFMLAVEKNVIYMILFYRQA